MHVASVTGSISQTYMQIIQIGTPMFGKYNLKGVNIKLPTSP